MLEGRRARARRGLRIGVQKQYFSDNAVREVTRLVRGATIAALETAGARAGGSFTRRSPSIEPHSCRSCCAMRPRITHRRFRHRKDDSTAAGGIPAQLRVDRDRRPVRAGATSRNGAQRRARRCSRSIIACVPTMPMVAPTIRGRRESEPGAPACPALRRILRLTSQPVIAVRAASRT